MKNLGITYSILGCEVLQDEYSGTFSTNQSKYIEFVCNKFLHNGGSTAQTPQSDTTLSKKICPKYDNDRNKIKYIPCKAVIECLLWLVTATRLPDIVSILAIESGVQ